LTTALYFLQSPVHIKRTSIVAFFGGIERGVRAAQGVASLRRDVHRGVGTVVAKIRRERGEWPDRVSASSEDHHFEAIVGDCVLVNADLPRLLLYPAVYRTRGVQRGIRWWCRCQ
jgi:hypothetical protein